jgi:hypothetical protein
VTGNSHQLVWKLFADVKILLARDPILPWRRSGNMFNPNSLLGASFCFILTTLIEEYA